MDKLLLTADEASELLGIGKTKLYELIWTGRISSVKIGKCRRIPADALRLYVATLTGEAA